MSGRGRRIVTAECPGCETVGRCEWMKVAISLADPDWDTENGGTQYVSGVSFRLPLCESCRGRILGAVVFRDTEDRVSPENLGSPVQKLIRSGESGDPREVAP